MTGLIEACIIKCFVLLPYPRHLVKGHLNTIWDSVAAAVLFHPFLVNSQFDPLDNLNDRDHPHDDHHDPPHRGDTLHKATSKRVKTSKQSVNQ